MPKQCLGLFLFLLSGSSLFSEPVDLTAFEWLAGVWEMNRDGRLVEEHWSTPSANALIGMSRTVKDGRTIEFEFLRIEKRGDDCFYVPQPNGRPPVAFKLVSSSGGRFVFENTSGEDRVNRIEYRRVSGDVLEARVEGAQNGKPFVLEYRYTRRK
jgi:uncharacterized protein DUF6265